MVVQNTYNTCERSVASAFAQTIHRGMYALNASLHSAIYICYSHIIIVMGMEIEAQVRVALNDVGAEFQRQVGRKYAKRVWQHETADWLGSKAIEHLIYVFWRVNHAIRPIFEVDIDLKTASVRQLYVVANVVDMLFGRFLQLRCYVAQRTLRK